MATGQVRRDQEIRGASAHQEREVVGVGTVAVLCGLLWTSYGSAATIHVPADVPTIGAAVENAAFGDSVVIAAGVYRGPGNRDVHVTTAGLTILGAGADSTTLDCEALGRGFWFESNDTAKSAVDGLAVRRGLSTGFGGGIAIGGNSVVDLRCVAMDSCMATGDLAHGGGMSIDGASRVTITHSNVRQCKVDGDGAYGGGCSINGGASLLVRDTSVLQCTANGNLPPRGGGLAVGDAAHLTLDRAIVQYNAVHRYVYYGGGDGGGIAVTGSAVAHIIGSRVTTNFAGVDDYLGKGAGVYVAAGCHLESYNSTYDNNYATIGGGIYGEQYARVELEDCEIVDNIALDYGGVVLWDGVVERCAIVGNGSVGSKGFVGRGGGIGVLGDRVDIARCTIVRNSAYAGSGLYIRDGAKANISHSIAWGNCDIRESSPGLDIRIDTGGTLAVTCSAWDTTSVSGGGLLVVRGTQVHTEPFVCAMLPCTEPYTTEDVWALGNGSPCAASKSPCGETIGYTAKECGALGACCTGGNACWILSEAECGARNGDYGGDQVDCNPLPCWGACCLTNGQCEYVSPEACEEDGGEWTGQGVLCEQAGCDAGGACCFEDGNCSVSTRVTCEAAGGVYHGDNSECDPLPCPPAGGCCLHGQGCVRRTEDACREAGGVYLGNDVGCDGQSCAVNAGGVLMLHVEDGIVYTNDGMYCGVANVSGCAQAVTRVNESTVVVAYVLAAFGGDASPMVTGVSFGVNYDSQRLVVVDYEACGDAELPQSEWPAPGSGTLVQWAQPETAHLFDVCWFAAYRYGLPGTTMELVLHPEDGAVFWDASIPPVLDPVVCLGALGFGVEGRICCPDEAVGACCLGVGVCAMVSRTQCVENGGVFAGYGVDCAAAPCPTTGVSGDGGTRSTGIDIVGEEPGRGAVEFDVMVEKRGRARIEVFDASGRRVAGVFEGEIDTGVHTFRQRVATAGVYFVSVDLDGQRLTRRVVIVR